MHPEFCVPILLAYFFHLCCAHLFPQANCSSCLPNPLATTYPNNVTGTINATTSVLLVPISYAQSLLPSRFANSILTTAYARFNISPTVYPLVVESVIDHDIRYNNSPVVADFSSFRITFPFIDLLGDGYSTFRYIGYIYLPPTNLVAINGSQGYGYTVLPAFFDPPDAPYKFASRKGRNRIFNVYEQTPSPPNHHHKSPSSKLIGSTHFRPSIPQSPIPLSFYKNVTNQIMFGNNTRVCDRMTSFWNTSITTGAYEPEAVVGEVLLSPPLVPRRKVWRNVPGLKANRAFLEVNYLSCEGLKGWSGTGSGDSG
ncbi:MAG: hypothetical protein L6R38_003886 [Xanthoria sp. 2 TBL-2021]|nr:MAG: hypothetical protein L6R38_003886 [Xanthoria sp. 2 TBL-2021]